MPRRRRRRRLTPLEKEQGKFRRRILSIFRMMDIDHLRTVDKRIIIGGQEGELDYVFLYENLIIICEDTVGQTDRDHLRGKNFILDIITNNKNDFINWLKQEFPDKFEKYRSYTNGRYKIFFIYAHKSPIDADTKRLFPNFKFLNEYDLRYFDRTTKVLKKTSRNDFFKFLNLDLSDIGPSSSTERDNDIETAVILPEESSGFPEGIKIISFLISAKDLLDCSYVLRKENWEENIDLYQRLLIPKKIQDIRNYIATKRRVFIDNIIVSLPTHVTLFRKNDNNTETIVSPENLSEIENLRMKIPRKINSIGIIDGQHRVFAHYESHNDRYETIISQMRNDRHLLVTGLLYPDSFGRQDKIKFESEIFLQINSTQKQVDAALLQHIESLKDPSSPMGIARKVLIEINQRSPFLDLFQIYSFETKKIKTPSITNWGLKELVKINEDEDTLFKYWTDTRKPILTNEERNTEYEEVFNDYIDFCASIISQFFNAVKTNFEEYWILDPSSKLLKVTAITGFIISLKMSLGIYREVKDFAFYNERLSRLTMDFSKEGFPFISSHWHRFGEEISRQCW